jgi:hypothetical protein
MGRLQPLSAEISGPARVHAEHNDGETNTPHPNWTDGRGERGREEKEEKIKGGEESVERTKILSYYKGKKI